MPIKTRDASLMFKTKVFEVLIVSCNLFFLFGIQNIVRGIVKHQAYPNIRTYQIVVCH